MKITQVQDSDNSIRITTETFCFDFANADGFLMDNNYDLPLKDFIDSEVYRIRIHRINQSSIVYVPNQLKDFDTVFITDIDMIEIVCICYDGKDDLFVIKNINIFKKEYAPDNFLIELDFTYFNRAKKNGMLNKRII